MARRLLSHLLITLAVLSLTATFFVWVIDATVLNPVQLTKALHDGGVPSALANVIPEQATKDIKNNDNGNTSGNNKVAEAADMKAKIAAVITPTYVESKLQTITATIINFMKKGSPQPTLDISDFPTKLRASGIAVGSDLDKNFSAPIQLNEKGSLDALPKAYSKFKLAKYIGVGLFIVLLTAEWFVAEKNQKLKRIGRIFLHAGIWYTLWWLVITVVPSRALPKLKDSLRVDASTNTLIDAVARSMQHLFSQYFLAFAITCWVLAALFYLSRHVRKHVDAIQRVPPATARQLATIKRIK